MDSWHSLSIWYSNYIYLSVGSISSLTVKRRLISKIISLEGKLKVFIEMANYSKLNK